MLLTLQVNASNKVTYSAHPEKWLTNWSCLTEKPAVNLQELEECVMKLGIARGNFQIAMAVNLASDIDKSGEFLAIFWQSLSVDVAIKATDATDAFLRKWLQPCTQAMLDDECLPGTRTSVFRRVEDWLCSGNLETSNVLWISGAPGAGKSAIATTLVKKLKSSNKLCTKV